MCSGVVIHRTVGDDGVVEVVQDHSIRSLYFDSDAKQSSMDIIEPERLVLSYTRAMMTSLLFCDSPKATALIGLGGGSIAKFLMCYLPHCSVDAVESRESVIKLAHGYFCLPDDARLETFSSDGLAFMSENRGRFKRYDLLLIDAFDHDGVSNSIKDQFFFESCYRRIENNGIVAINLWNHRRDGFADTVKSLEIVFKGNVLLLSIKDKGNVIAFAAKNPKLFSSLNSLKLKAQKLEGKIEIEFCALLRQLRKQNRWRTFIKFL